MLVAGPMAGWLGGRFGSKLPLMIGTAVASASFVFLALLHDERWSIYLGSGLLGIRFSFAAMANLIVEAVDQTKNGIATGINTVMRTIAGSLGGQIAASVVASHVVAATGLPEEAGFTTAFVISAVGVGLAFAAAVAIPASVGRGAAPVTAGVRADPETQPP